MDTITTGVFSSLESSLYFVWGITFISVALGILLKSNLREQVLQVFENKTGRYLVVGLCFLIAIVHLYSYQFVSGGTDLMLIAIGFISALKGIVLLLFPSVLKISEQILLSKYMSGWLLVVIAFGIYLLNQVLHFITL